jgi:threonine dehydrogenase-like Zn-dependent dehydrogenase
MPGADSTVAMSGRIRSLTHRFALDDIVEAHDIFSDRHDGVLKVAIRP